MSSGNTDWSIKVKYGNTVYGFTNADNTTKRLIALNNPDMSITQYQMLQRFETPPPPWLSQDKQRRDN